MKSAFKGSVVDFIGTTVLALVISVCTLGLGIPWAICLYRSWRVKNTVIEGRRFVFDGTGGELFLQCVRWAICTVFTCGIYLLWVPIRLQDWLTKHTYMIA